MRLGSRSQPPPSTEVARNRDTRADERVRRTLEELREQGFVVVHDVEREGPGPDDHVVSGPSGLFLIAARRRRCSDEDLYETLQRSDDLFRELETWVTPVICLTSRLRGKPHRRERVWVVPRRRLVEWIAGRRNPVLESERIAELAGQLQTGSSETPASILVTAVRSTLLGRAQPEETDAEPDDEDTTEVESEQSEPV